MQLLFTQENIVENLLRFTEPQFVWIGFAIILFLFTIITFILLYHWNKYSYTRITTGFVKVFYLVGSFILIGGIFLALTSYTILL